MSNELLAMHQRVQRTAVLDQYESNEENGGQQEQYALSKHKATGDNPEAPALCAKRRK